MNAIQLGWRFRPSPVDGGRSGGDQAAMNFEHDLEVFTREVLQNSLDAKRPDSSFVHVEFVVESLTGAAKLAFLAAMDWKALRGHLLAAKKLAPTLAESIRRLDARDDPLVTLSIHDGNALGLSGPERGSGRFATFARNKLLSDKETGSAGGSFGLGKSVLWAFSGISTVLVHSKPHDEQSAPPARFIGIAQLPWHQTEGGEFDGPGWFGLGERDGGIERSVSFAADPADLATLRLARAEAMGTGTSIVVPDIQTDLSPQQLVDALSRAAAKWFWPAMVGPNKSLAVHVRFGDSRKIVDPRQERELRPFLHLMGLEEHPVWTPRTAEGPAALQLPAVLDILRHQERFEFHEAKAVKNAFQLKALALDEGQGELDKHMAWIRGARMVVKYVRMNHDKPCWAIALAGTARGTGTEDRLVEQFLRHAEPPSHDDWEPYAPKLHVSYERGYVGELKGLRKRLTDAAVVLLRRQDPAASDQEVPAALRKALAVSLSSIDGPKQREGRFDYLITEASIVEEAGESAWRFAGWVHNSREGEWELQVEAWLDTDGERLDLAVSDLVVDGLFVSRTESGVRIRGTSRFTFRGRCPLSQQGRQAQRGVFGLDVKHKPVVPKEVEA